MLLFVRHVSNVESKSIGFDLKTKRKFQIFHITHHEFINCATDEHCELKGNLLSLFGLNYALLGFKASNDSRWIINFFPVESHRQITVVYKLQILRAILALAMFDCFTNSRIYFAQFNRISVQIHFRLLDFADDLEVLGFGAADHHLKVLLKAFLVYTFAQKFNIDGLVWSQRSIAHIERHCVSSSCLYRFSNNDSCS